MAVSACALRVAKMVQNGSKVSKPAQNSVMVTSKTAFYWAYSDDRVHYKSDKTVIFFAVLDVQLRRL